MTVGKVDLNQTPYHDDFNARKNYVQILFHPRRDVQVRELNQLQTIIKHQLSLMGDHVFEQGAQVYPSSDTQAVKFDRNNFYVKVNAGDFSSIDNLSNIVQDATFEVTSGARQGLQGKCIGFRDTDSQGEVRLYLNYTVTGNDGVSHVLQSGDEISFETGETVVVASGQNKTGKVASCTVEEGVYYWSTHFILVERQVLFFEPSDPENDALWNNLPTSEAGLTFTEVVITYNDDQSLRDNVGDSNSTAGIGADRLSVIAALTQNTTGSESAGNFVPLLRVRNGIEQFRVTRTDYSILERTLAERTSEESGDYTIDDFICAATPFLILGSNGGRHRIEEYFYDTQEEAEEADRLIFNGAGNAHLETGITTELLIEHSRSEVENHLGTPTGRYLPATSLQSFIDACESKATLEIDRGLAYVKGFRIEKLDTSYLDIDKARDLNYRENISVNTNLGTYIVIHDLFNRPNIESQAVIDLYDQYPTSDVDGGTSGDKIGEARVLSISFENEISEGVLSENGDYAYRLYLYDVEMDTGKTLSDVRFVYHSTPETFNATVQKTYRRQAGNVSWGSIAGSVTTLVGSGTLWEDDPNQRLKVGDYIRVTVNETTGQQEIFRVITVTSNTSVVVSNATDYASSMGTSVIDKVLTRVEGSNRDSGLLYTLPERFTRSLRSGTAGNPNTTVSASYVTREAFSGTDGTPITLPTNNTFITPADSRTNLMVFGSLAPLEYTTGTPISGQWTISAISASSITLDTAGVNFTLIALVRKTVSAAKESGKTITDGTLETADNRVDLTTIELPHTDAYEITSVTMSSGFTTTPVEGVDEDVTQYYTLDDGQRTHYYESSKIILKPTAPRPTGKLLIKYKYLSHGSSKYFSVDSYPQELGYENIPTFNATAHGDVSLRDILDFRGRKVGSTVTPADVPVGLFIANYHYYQNRIDCLYLDKSGAFFVRKGKAGVDPIPPETPSSGMGIYNLLLRAFTESIDDIFLQYIDNRRYTMNDIGKIDNRIKTLEKFTVLNTLEKETEDLQLKDAQGLDRFKNGFVVDNFSTFGVVDVTSSEFRCSIDTDEGILRPRIEQNSVQLIERYGLTDEATAETFRSEAGYQKTGALYTLKYEHETLLEQDKCSKVVNVNPFAVFTFIGRMGLTPASDTWRATNVLAPRMIEDNSQFDQVQAQIGTEETVWGEWQSNVIGRDRQRIGRGREVVVSFGENQPDATHSTRWPRTVGTRVRVRTTTTTQNTRTGVRRDIVEQPTIQRNLGNRTVGVRDAKWIRSREVLVDGQGFKPNSRLYPIFDGVDLESFSRQLVENEAVLPQSDGAIFTTPRDQAGINQYTSELNEQLVFNGSTLSNVVAGGSPTAKESELATMLATAGSLVNKSDEYLVIEGTANDGMYTVSAVGTTNGVTTITINETFPVSSASPVSTRQVNGSTLVSQNNIRISKRKRYGSPIVTDGSGSFSAQVIIPDFGWDQNARARSEREEVGLPVTEKPQDFLIEPSHLSAWSQNVPRFRTGERRVVFSTLPARDGGFENDRVDTHGFATYTAQGTIRTEQETIVSVRQFSVVETPISETNTSTNTEVRNRIVNVHREDPIAQTFFIDSEGGCFITAVDVFFITKDPSVGVKLQVRPTNPDGSPSTRLVPFGEVFKNASEVVTNNIDTEAGDMLVVGDGTQSGFSTAPWLGSDSINADDIRVVTTQATNAELAQVYQADVEPKVFLSGGMISGTSVSTEAMDKPSRFMVPTRFIFDSPIYLSEGEDYCFVLLADSTDYRVWISQTGNDVTLREEAAFVFRDEGDVNVEIGTNIPVLKDPYLNGVFYKSSNGRHWNLDQTADIKFKIHKAKFDVQNTGTLELVNEPLPAIQLGRDALELFEGSTKARVHFPNHGHIADGTCRVILSGWSGGTQFGLDGSTTGLPTIEGSRERIFVVEHANLDSFVIDFNADSNGVEIESGLSGSTTSTFCGGARMICSKQYNYQLINPNIETLELPETSVVFTMIGTGTHGIHDADFTPFRVTNRIGIEGKENTSFTEPLVVASVVNELPQSDGGASLAIDSGGRDSLGYSRSLKVRATLISGNENISPVIDSDRIDCVLVNNRVSNTKAYDGGIPTIDYAPVDTLSVSSGTTALAISGSTISSTDATVREELAVIDAGKFIVVVTDGNISVPTKVESIDYNEGTSTTITLAVPLVTSGDVTLTTPSTSYSVTQYDEFVAEEEPFGGSEAFKYATRRFTLARPSTALRVSFAAYRDTEGVIEVYVKLIGSGQSAQDVKWQSLPFNTQIGDTFVEQTPDPSQSLTDFRVYECTLNDAQPFTEMEVKIVGKTSNPALPPLIRDFTAIALDQ